MTWIKLTAVSDGGDRLVSNEVWVNLNATLSIAFFDKGLPVGTAFLQEIARAESKTRSPWAGKPAASVAMGDRRYYVTVTPREIAALRQFLQTQGS